MPASPFLVLVDPRKQRRAHLLQRALAIVAGAVVAGASAVPFVASLGH